MPMNFEDGIRKNLILPKGRYAMKIVSAEKRTIPMGEKLEVVYEVISDGKYKGVRPFKDTFINDSKFKWKYEPFFISIGVPEGTKLIDERKHVLGKKLIVRVSRKVLDNAVINNYIEYDPFDESFTSEYDDIQEADEEKEKTPVKPVW